jgi:glycosyltransferase involved in cell wall biosynthesis
MNGLWAAAAALVYSGTLHTAYMRATEPGTGPARAPRYDVSLLIPAYNEENYIGKLLDSAATQSEPFAEYVVANAGNDRTEAIALDAGALVVPCEYGNIAASRNAAADMSHGEILIFCDADMCLSGHLVERCVDALASGYACAVPSALFYDSHLWNILSWGPRQARHAFWPKLTLGIVAVWRDVYREIGGYDINCNPMDLENQCREDRDFGNRIVARYGPNAVKGLPDLATTSARRIKAYGLFAIQTFDETPRRFLDAGIAGRMSSLR